MVSSLTNNNLRGLLSSETYTLHLATYNTNGTDVPEDDSLTDGTETITLSKTVYSENPIFKTEVLTINNEKVGYLMYNGFVSDYDAQLNAAFAEFQAQNIQQLDIGLALQSRRECEFCDRFREYDYGAFQWNISRSYSTIATCRVSIPITISQARFQKESPLTRSALDKVYVITTGSSASASEMMVNSLRSHIEVVQIGTKTVGKSQASITLYDSPDFRKTRRQFGTFICATTLGRHLRKQRRPSSSVHGIDTNY